MKTFISFLIGIILFATLAIIALTGSKSFDASRDFSISSVIFQPADLSRDRIEKPIALDALSDEFVRDNLIKKFVYEYFYVIPDTDDIDRRRESSSVLYRMSEPSVFNEWDDTIAEDIDKMASQNMLRRVVVNNIDLPPSSEYYQISYDLLTWDVANDITRAPKIEKDKKMSIRLEFEKGQRQYQTNGARFDIKKYLSDGGDPATIFRFRVQEVIVK